MRNGFTLIPAYSVVALAESLAQKIKLRENPLRPELILVMNFAQRVWLNRFLAEKHGICANIRFASPERFLEEISGGSHHAAFEQESLRWRIFEALKEMHAPGSALAADLRFGLEDKPDDEIFRVADNLGNLFWRYQSFRPQMIRDWMADAPIPQQNNPDFRREYVRQKHLWRRVIPADALPPAVAWLNMLENPTPISGLPPRIFAFAPSALPRLHVLLLKKLAQSSEVSLYYHNLSSDLWTETVGRKKLLLERRKRLREQRPTEPLPQREPEDDLTALIRGNELLTSWGKAARPLAMHLIDSDFAIDDTVDAPPQRDSLLHTLQHEIRLNNDIAQLFTPPESDSSLRIDIAPSPLREMEILRNNLIARFAEDPTLRPRDVLVCLPDVEKYSPFIRAAFENSKIPFSIADRSGTDRFPVASAFLEILRVARGEFHINEVLSLLDFESVRKALDLDESVLPALRNTLANAAIRWGLDTEFRHQHIFGETTAADNVSLGTAKLLSRNNSWEFGLRRLAHGYMCAPENDVFLFENTAAETYPGCDLTETASALLGKISSFIKKLTALNAAFTSKEERSVPEWCDFLKKLLSDDFLVGEKAEANVLNQGLSSLGFSSVFNGPDNRKSAPRCTFETVFTALKMQNWGNPASGSGMLRGKVTFCRMQPMRNIPARVICIAGLSDGAFPRSGHSAARDLIAIRSDYFPPEITLWDRTPRDEDNLLLLETILAAKEALLLSYVGRKAEDGSVLPPCVPLAKLRDFLVGLTNAETTATDNANDDKDAPVHPDFETKHRLHGFAADYFSADAKYAKKFRSFSATDFSIAQRSFSQAFTEKTDSDEKKAFTLPPAPKEFSQKQIESVLCSPAKYVCEKVLGIAPNKRAEVLEEEDPEAPVSTLDLYCFATDFIEDGIARGIRGEELEIDSAIKDLYTRCLASGTTAVLEPYETFAQKLTSDCSALPKIIREHVPAGLIPVPVHEIPKKIVVELSSGNAEIKPELRNLYQDEAGNLFLFLTGKKSFGWPSAVHTFVSAQILSAAFPDRDFTVVHFHYGSKTSEPQVITRDSLLRARQPANLFWDRCCSFLNEPPLIFEALPITKIKEKNSDEENEETFVTEVGNAFPERSNTLDICELFVFGQTFSPELKEHVRDFVFPFARGIRASFLTNPSSGEKTGAKKPGKKRTKK